MQDFSAVDLRASYDHVIAGEDAPPESGETFTTLDPATEDGIAEVARGTEADVDRAVAVARDVQQGWRETLPRERGRILRQVADALSDHVAELAQLTTLENGKPISEARAEAETAVESVEYFAGIADKVHGKQIPRGQEYADFTYREPYGVTAHIVPWNFPLQLMAQSVAAAMATGNTVVVKPGEETSLGTLRFAEIANETDLPAGVFNVVTGYGGEAGAPLAGHRDVDTVTFTGSTETGRKVAKLAADNITPVNLELGGKGPNVVFPDADVDHALDNAVDALFTIVSGQCCSAGSRLLLHEDIYAEFTDRLIGRVRALDIGRGIDDPDMGPMINDSQYEKVRGYLDVGRQEAGEPAIGGSPLDRDGYFVEPTIFTDVDNSSRLAQEEIFGPILPVIRFSSEAEAIELANDTQYGLTAGIFTSDIGRAHRFARDVQAGGIYINQWFAEGIETPFGGFKQSGIGREKSVEAVKHYTQPKNVCANITI